MPYPLPSYLVAIDTFFSLKIAETDFDKKKFGLKELYLDVILFLGNQNGIFCWFFFSGQALTPNLVAGPLKKDRFFCGSPYEVSLP